MRVLDETAIEINEISVRVESTVCSVFKEIVRELMP